VPSLSCRCPGGVLLVWVQGISNFGRRSPWGWSLQSTSGRTWGPCTTSRWVLKGRHTPQWAEGHTEGPTLCKAKRSKMEKGAPGAHARPRGEGPKGEEQGQSPWGGRLRVSPPGEGD